MKVPFLHLFCLLFFCLSGISLSGFSQQNTSTEGIAFFSGSWSEALQEAKKQNKLIFVDVYTDWCGPCKVMDKYVFPLKEVGDLYNQLFINYKINAEKGEGIEIAKKYGIRAYPTFLFTDGEGYLIEKIEGEREPQPFMHMARNAVATGREKSQLKDLEGIFRSGNRDQVFLKTYIEALHAKNLDNTEVLNEYFKQIKVPELYQDTTLMYLARHARDVNSAALLHVIENYDNLPEESRVKLAVPLFDRLVRRGAGAALMGNRLMEYNYLVSFSRKLAGLNEKDRELLDRLDLRYAELIRNYALIRQAGYSLVGKTYEIPEEQIKQEDRLRYNQIMKPFLTGERDSTKVPGFEEEKQFTKRLFTLEVTEKLYTAARHFVLLPPEESQAKRDAVLWIERCILLYPENKVFGELLKQLESSF